MWFLYLLGMGMLGSSVSQCFIHGQPGIGAVLIVAALLLLIGVGEMKYRLDRLKERRR